MSKYHNTKTEVDGIIFDSKKEAEYYLHLKEEEGKGNIKNLVLQPRFELIPSFDKNGRHFRKTVYVADFMYYDVHMMRDIVIDVKGVKTNVYKIKKKMFEYRYKDLYIVEV